MSYKTTTINEVINDIESSKFFLPAIQRKFVWQKPQIELLFDSLMKNYPIGTFLFWYLPKKKADDYVFYDFLKVFDVRDPYNVKHEGAFMKDEIIGVLDGQQRLSSLYLALQGTYTEKKKYCAVSKASSYVKYSLYLNLFSLPYVKEENIKLGISKTVIDEDKDFQFQFLSETDASKINNKEFWFNVRDIMRMGKDKEIDAYYEKLKTSIVDEKLQIYFESKKAFIKKAIETIHDRIYKDDVINYFKEERTELDDILKIFVRVNSGGTILSRTDLLFSTIVATWADGREQIEDFIKEINQIGDGFSFNNDFLMRSCLVLSDLPVLFKVNSFKTENVQLIKNNWESIKESLDKTVELIASFGFSGSVLTSQNSIIVIAYHFMKGGTSSSTSREGLRKYLLHSLLKNVYGGQGDQVIKAFRDALRKEVEPNVKKYELKNIDFQFEELLKFKLPADKKLDIVSEDIEDFMSYKKGANAFFVLSLLYPNLRYSEVKFHQDHIHPDSRFSNSKLDSIGITKDKWAHWQQIKDSVPNLQLMEGKQNASKNAIPFKEWLYSKNESYKFKFCSDNYIPSNVEYDLVDFDSFYFERKKLIKEELIKVLEISNN